MVDQNNYEEKIINEVQNTNIKADELYDFCDEISKALGKNFSLPTVSAEIKDGLFVHSDKLIEHLVSVIQKRQVLQKLIVEKDWEELTQAHSEFVLKVQETTELANNIKYELDKI